jgi:hypothetical protein
MKGFAALITFLVISFFYIGTDGYERYIKRFGHATYDAAKKAQTIPDTLESVQKRAQEYQAKKAKEERAKEVALEVASSSILDNVSPYPVTHIKTPTNVRAVYMSSWVAGTPSVRNKIISLIDDTEINAVVIDVKDNTGLLSWNGRINDLDKLLFELHEKNIYVIARVAAFQDPLYVKKHPEIAVKNKNTGEVWVDHKGVPWIDTGSHQMWEYLLGISKEAYSRGFDEINLDYIRFPTDGELSLMSFPVSGIRGKTDKQGIVREFYKYITDELRAEGIPSSGDLFGIIMLTKTDIPVLGQDLHDGLTYFDYIAPMVYPSHFYPMTAGLKNPAAHPGEVITYAMSAGITIADEVASSTGQSTSTIRAKLRPWYQDFDMGARYTKELVRAQIDAGEKIGINSWMLWDPANTYTKDALKSD